MSPPTASPAGGPARRVGYLIAALINGALLYFANVWPGWQVLPFLADNARQVLDIVNVSLIAGIVVNVVYLFLDLSWLKALGDLVTLGIGLAVLARLWQVFPFDFQGSSFDWALLVRILLVVAGVGSAIGIIVQVVMLIRSLLGLGGPTSGRQR
ncbi:MAG TPA: hypothetical protein VFC59_08875 [Cryobacterium sp.]|nr:hypothetical protein [Cryobacterium sp.]